MHGFHRHSRRGRKLLLLAGAVLLAAAITQCRMVTDNVVRARIGTAQASDCLKNCAKAANDALHAENDLHVTNVHACNGDTTCLAQEDARHDAAVAAIQNARQACQNNCHHQGGGTGGR